MGVLCEGLGAIKGQCEILQRGRKNKPMHHQRLGSYWLESSFAEKNLGVLVNTKLTTSQQRTPLWQRQPTRLLGCVRKTSVTSRSREMHLLLHPREMACGVLCPVLGCPVQK